MRFRLLLVVSLIFSAAIIWAIAHYRNGEDTILVFIVICSYAISLLAVDDNKWKSSRLIGKVDFFPRKLATRGVVFLLLLLFAFIAAETFNR